MVLNALHVSGVGALGSFVLWELQRRGIEFTWDDLESRFNAWEVSTGSISPYPDSDLSLYAKGYRFWRDYASASLAYPEHAKNQFLERTTALYARKRQPVETDLVAELGEGYKLYRHYADAFQLNVQAFVLHTRQTFAGRRREREDADPDICRLRCRGIGNVDTYALWGWQAPALLNPVGDMIAGPFAPEFLRPAFHFNDPRLPRNSFYFLPVPGYPEYWWVGSDIVLQRTPMVNTARALDRLREFGGWGHKLFGHLFTFTYAENQVGEGWRPIRRLRDAPMDRAVEVQPGVYQAPPLNRSGIQCGPLVAHWICDQLFGVRRMPVGR